MITIGVIKMYCSKCEESHFVTIPGDDVVIDIDLKTDEYVFHATCPDCGNEITNRRRMY